MAFDELAQRLFGARRAESDAILTDATTGTIHGVALTDSEGGAVTVEITADVTAPEPLEVGDETYFADAGVGVEIPTSESVRAGDEVLVSTYGAGTMRSPVVTAAVGSGDRMAAAVQDAHDLAASVESIAQEAKEVAEATGQHFWPDDDGVHVTEVTQDEWQTAPTGANVLLNALGMLFRRAMNPLLALVTGSNPGVAIYDGEGDAATNVVASFTSAGQVIGRTDESHLEADYHSIQLINKEGDTYFWVSDLRDQSGSAEVIETFDGDGTKKTFNVAFTPSSVTSVLVDGTAATYSWSGSSAAIVLDEAPPSGSVVTVDYVTQSPGANAFTFGSRKASERLGASSFAAGRSLVASGLCSHAEGSGTKAIGPESHAEGYFTTASGGMSHAEGLLATASGTASHAEGGSTASGTDAHAEGSVTTASGNFSHAEGITTTASGTASHAEGSFAAASGEYSHAEGQLTSASGLSAHASGTSTRAVGDYSTAMGRATVAYGEGQTTMGRNNLLDTSNVYALIVGNGSSSTSRSNAFAIGWDGRVAFGTTVFTQANVILALTNAAKSNTWVTVSAANWVTMNSGYSITASDLKYNAYQHRIIGSLTVRETTGHSAGNNVCGTVKSAYRPPARQIIHTTTNGAYKMFVDAGGGLTLVLGSATSGTTDHWFALDYIVDG